jgi:hypothetical protein
MIDHSGPSIQRQVDQANRRLAEKIIKKHKQGKQTGASPELLKKFYRNLS